MVTKKTIIIVFTVLGICATFAIAAAVIYAVLLRKFGDEDKEDICLQLDECHSCYSNNSNPYRYYGTKTAYSVATRSVSNDFSVISGCEPELFYLFSRHAVRYPDKDKIENMEEQLPFFKWMIKKFYDKEKCTMCEEDLKNLESWSLNMEPDFDNKITESGEKDAEELAKRFRQRFMSILAKDYSPEDFQFAYTSRERTLSTAVAFAKGLFDEGAQRIDFSSKTLDDILQFHKVCKDIQKRKNCSKENSLEEIEKFENGTLMQNMQKRISERVGFMASPKDIKLMYSTCEFEFAIDGESPWCSVFTEDDFKILEYLEDLDDYYKDAYGNSRNFEQACPVVKFIIEKISQVTSDSQPAAVLHFSHAGAIKKLIAHFGLFKDDTPLLADNMCSHNRQWRSSKICPFNSNFALVLWNCTEEYMVTAYVNEKPVILDGCSNEICPLDTFLDKYKPIADKCNLEKICCKK